MKQTNCVKLALRSPRSRFLGSLGTSVFDTDVYLVGASGGVYALLAAHLANVLLNYNNMEFGIVRLIGIFVIGKWTLASRSDRRPENHPLTSEGRIISLRPCLLLTPIFPSCS